MAVTFSLPMKDQKSPSMPRRTSPISFFGMSVFQFFLLSILLTFPSLTKANLEDSCVTDFDANTDYFPDKTQSSEAEDFMITYHNHYKMVVNERTNEMFALHQCGTPAPSVDPSVKVFSIPLSSVGVTSTVEIPFFEMLGVRDKIKYVSGPQFVSSPCVQKLIVDGDIMELSSNDTIRADQEENLDGVFVFSAEPNFPKRISISTSQDPGALHRAEWIDFVSTFFNTEARANEIYSGIKERYECFSQRAQGYSNPSPPTVAWVDYLSWSSNKFSISTTEYKLEYITDLGATPLKPNPSSFATAEEWRQAMQNVDIVIDETYQGTLEDFYSNFGLDENSSFPFIQNKQIWRFDKLQSDLEALDWFETAVANPDTVLQDLYTIVHPEDDIGHTRVWFRNIAEGEAVVVETACANPSAPLPTRSSECESAASAVAPLNHLVFLLAFLSALAFFLH